MKVLKIFLLLSVVLFLTGCASGYREINPEGLSYQSSSRKQDVSVEYKYDLLRKKYSKKEQKKDIRLVALRISNNSERDLVFGRDIKVNFDNGDQVILLGREKVFSELKQHPASYLFYLLLTPISVYTTNSNSNGYDMDTESFPVGLIVGPGLAGGNLIAAASANKKFKNELAAYDILGKTIPKGETVYGLLGLRADNYEALRISIIDPEITFQSGDATR